MNQRAVRVNRAEAPVMATVNSTMRQDDCGC